MHTGRPLLSSEFAAGFERVLRCGFTIDLNGEVVLEVNTMPSRPPTAEIIALSAGPGSKIRFTDSNLETCRPRLEVCSRRQ